MLGKLIPLWIGWNYQCNQKHKCRSVNILICTFLLYFTVISSLGGLNFSECKRDLLFIYLIN